MGLPKGRVYDRSFKLAALARLAAGESVSGVARALGIRRELLCEWRKAYRAGGAAALRERGRPSLAAKVALARPSGELPPGLPPPDELALARQRIAALEPAALEGPRPSQDTHAFSACERHRPRRRRRCAIGCSSWRWRIGTTAIAGWARCCATKAGR